MPPPVAPYRGRFAPSPTGELHLGGAATALLAASAARRSSGRLVLRVDDLDAPRVVAGSEEGIADELRWLGIEFDESPERGGALGPYRQSERLGLYREALERLEAAGLTYLCDCSRAEIARAASAPHAGEEGPRYPGRCRGFGMRARSFRRPPALRLAIPEARVVRYADARKGQVEVDVHAYAGDFVLRRGDGVFAYQLAAAVDDAAMGITEVVRGADLEPSAPLQALLIELLGRQAPRYVHLPLVVGPDEARLAKRHGGSTVRAWRERGGSPEDLVSAIAAAYGHRLPLGEPPLAALAAMWDPLALPHRPVPLARIAGTSP